MGIRCVEGEGFPDELGELPWYAKKEDNRYFDWMPAEVCVLDPECLSQHNNAEQRCCHRGARHGQSSRLQ